VRWFCLEQGRHSRELDGEPLLPTAPTLSTARPTMQEMYFKQKVKDCGGPGGLVVVTVDSAQLPSSTSDDPQLPTFVTLELGGAHQRTHVVSGGVAPVFSSHFGFAVSAASPVGFVRVLLMSWAAVGPAELLGEGIIKLRYGMLPRSPEPAQARHSTQTPMGFGNWKAAPLESRAKAAARVDLEVCAGWVGPSSRGLWGGGCAGNPIPDLSL
jgi:hypothetical protein